MKQLGASSFILSHTDSEVRLRGIMKVTVTHNKTLHHMLAELRYSRAMISLHLLLQTCRNNT